MIKKQLTEKVTSEDSLQGFKEETIKSSLKEKEEDVPRLGKPIYIMNASMQVNVRTTPLESFEFCEQVFEDHKVQDGPLDGDFMQEHGGHGVFSYDLDKVGKVWGTMQMPKLLLPSFIVFLYFLADLTKIFGCQYNRAYVWVCKLPIHNKVLWGTCLRVWDPGKFMSKLRYS